MGNPQAVVSSRKLSTLHRIERELRRDPNLKSPKTFAGYLCDLKDFEDWRKGEPMTKTLVEEYARARQEEGKSPSTINRELAAIRWWARKLADLAYEDRHLSKAERDEIAVQATRVTLVRDVRGERLPKGRMVSKKELDDLLAACFADRLKDGTRSPAGARDAAVFSLACTSGLRVSELAALRLADVKQGAKWHVVVEASKGDKSRKLPVQSEARKRLREWLAVRGAGAGPLFLAVNKSGKVRRGHGVSDVALGKLLDKRARQAGIVEPIMWHDFRRTFASNLLDKGVDIVTVQKLMGHASPTTTSLYDRRGDRAQEEAIERLVL